jgi:hypothetical protein
MISVDFKKAGDREILTGFHLLQSSFEEALGDMNIGLASELTPHTNAIHSTWPKLFP